MTAQGSLFEQEVRLPVVLGRIKETNEFYNEAAERAIRSVTFKRDRLAVMVTKTGFLVVDDTSKVEETTLKFHVLTINYRTDPDELASCMKQTAFQLGFDEGVRKGRKRECRD